MISWTFIGGVYAMCIFWLGYEMYKAPLMDEDGNVINQNKNK